MLDIQKELERMRAETQVVCPYCGYNITDDCEAMQGLITYHAEDGIQKIECMDCGEEFYVEEHVRRTYTVGKKVVKDKFGYDVIEVE